LGTRRIVCANKQNSLQRMHLPLCYFPLRCLIRLPNTATRRQKFSGICWIKGPQSFLAHLSLFRCPPLFQDTNTKTRAAPAVARANYYSVNSRTNWMIFGSFPIKKKECACTKRFDNLASELAWLFAGNTLTFELFPYGKHKSHHIHHQRKL
jgi:hypothetical protein